MTESSLERQAMEIATEIVDLIAQDADFREAMKIDPEGAMAAAGFAGRVDALIDEAERDDVVGFGSIAPAFQLFSRPALRGGTIVASAFPSSGCCGASASGDLFSSPRL